MTDKEKATLIGEVLRGERVWCNNCEVWHTQIQKIHCAYDRTAINLAREIEKDMFVGSAGQLTLKGMLEIVNDERRKN